MSVLETKDWFPYIVSTGGADIINYYLAFGISAGVVATGLFCYLLVCAFSQLGRALAAVRSQAPLNSKREPLLWALGVVLTIHVFNWFGMVYFDQYNVVFFIQLAAISTLSHIFINDSIMQIIQEDSFSIDSREKRYSRYRSTVEGRIAGIVRPVQGHLSRSVKHKC